MLGATRLVKALLVLSGACCALVPAGCASEIEQVCDLQCDCTGCSEARYIDCVDRAKESEKKASDAGCQSRFTKYLACFEDEIECRDDQLSSDGCEDEEVALRECGVSVFRSLCELANEHQSNECQAGSFMTGSECTGPVECQAKCVLDAACDAFTGANQAELRRFNECIGGC